jgi:hypothetical protein
LSEWSFTWLISSRNTNDWRPTITGISFSSTCQAAKAANCECLKIAVGMLTNRPFPQNGTCG